MATRTPTMRTGYPEESKTIGSKGGPVLKPTGTHYPWYSLAPIKEAVPWSARSAKYFADLMKANGGASVFKGHPGLKVTFLTDYISTEWFLSQPQSVLDRQVWSTGKIPSIYPIPVPPGKKSRKEYESFCTGFPYLLFLALWGDL